MRCADLPVIAAAESPPAAAARPRRMATTLARALLAATLCVTLASCKAPARRTTRPATPPAQPAEPARPPADKGDPQARFDEALQLMRSGKAAEAEAAFTALAKDFPQFSGPYTNLGIINGKARRREQAIGNFSRAETANPANVVALNLLALQYRELSNFPLAEQTWRRALQVKPDYPAAHLNLALLYEQHMGRPAEALDHYRDYDRLTGGKELRVKVWMIELERRLSAAAPVAPPPSVTPSPAAPASARPPASRRPNLEGTR